MDDAIKRMFRSLPKDCPVSLDALFQFANIQPSVFNGSRAESLSLRLAVAGGE